MLDGFGRSAPRAVIVPILTGCFTVRQRQPSLGAHGPGLRCLGRQPDRSHARLMARLRKNQDT